MLTDGTDKTSSFLLQVLFSKKPKAQSDPPLAFNLGNSAQDEQTEETTAQAENSISSHYAREDISSSELKNENGAQPIANSNETSISHPAPETHSTTDIKKGEIAPSSLESGEQGEVIPIDEESRRGPYITGIRFYMMVLSICICLFLVNLEITIVSTSLIAITNDLGGWSKNSWVLEAYLLTYVGFLIIWSKFSDIFGRKLTFVTCTVLFTVFSGACGAAQTMTQLILLRALQGLGAAGIFALGVIMLIESVPKHKVTALTGLVTAFFAMAMMLGPILGGAINERSSWRWIFLLNVPAGCAALVGLLVFIPNGYPYHGQPSPSPRSLLSAKTLQRIDWVGAILLLAATIFVCTAFEQAGIAFPWESAFVISMLVVSGVLWLLFLGWERCVSRKGGVREAVCPWRFLSGRSMVGMLLNSFLVGPALTVPVYQLPQRFQVVNGSSAVHAGVQLLPFCFMIPLGILISSVLAGRLKIPPVYVMLAGGVMQVVGFALLSTIEGVGGVERRQYGYQVLGGLGSGMAVGMVVISTPFVVELRDQSVALGAVAQFRVMGSAVGVAITTSVLNNYLRDHLAGFLTNGEIERLLQSTQSIGSFDEEVREEIRRVFGRGYAVQMRILVGICAVQVLSVGLVWRRRNVVV